MLSLNRKQLFSLFLACIWTEFDGSGAGVWADRNVSVDDLDVSRISYSSGWSEASFPSGFQIGGSHAFSLTRGSTATFTFTGSAVYYLAPGWPYSVSTQVTLDGGLPEVVFMVDPNHQGPVGGPPTSQSIIRWKRTGLTNTSHTLTASMAADGSFVVVDAFIFTIPDPVSSSASSTSTSASTSGTQGGSNPTNTASRTQGGSNPSSTDSRTQGASSPTGDSRAPGVSNPTGTDSASTSTVKTKSSSHTAAIVGSVLGALLVLLLLIIAALLFIRRRKKDGVELDPKNETPTGGTRNQPSMGDSGMNPFGTTQEVTRLPDQQGSNIMVGGAVRAGGYSVEAPLAVGRSLEDSRTTNTSSPPPEYSIGRVPQVWNPSAGRYPYGDQVVDPDSFAGRQQRQQNEQIYQQQQQYQRLQSQQQHQQQYALDSRYGTRGSFASSGSRYSQDPNSPLPQSPPGSAGGSIGSQRAGGQQSFGYDADYTPEVYYSSPPPKQQIHLSPPGAVPPEGGAEPYYPADMVQAAGGHVYGERLSTVMEGSQYSGATSPRSAFERAL